MKRIYRSLRTRLEKHQKYAPLIFFVGGFIFDSMTLGRIDRLYDLVVLCLYMTLLTVTICLYNLADDGAWKRTVLGPYEKYFPWAIQFFFGGLSSAFVIYFLRSVSLSKTMFFFAILVALLLANEFLKKRISNKYLQFSIYFFVSFTFFTFIIPVFIKMMNTDVFLFSGSVSLVVTLLLIIILYAISPSTRAELRLGKMIGIVLSMYIAINLFYFLNLIPPVPLALEHGMVAHSVEVVNNQYVVTYETNDWYVFWRKHRIAYIHTPGENVYVFSSIFAPTDIQKTISHRWNWYNDDADEWEIVEDIGYDITGGRDEGYRGYTFKSNARPGLWKVEVITEEEQIIGVIDFELIVNPALRPARIAKQTF